MPIASTNPIANVTQGMNLAQGGSFTDLGGRTGTVNYDAATGQKLGTGATTTALATGGTYSPQSTTTLSSDKTSDILNAQNTTNKYATGNGVTTTPEGVSTTADGAVYTPYETPEPIKTNTGGYVGETYYAPGAQLPTDNNGKPMALTETSASSDAIKKSLNNLKAQSDALTSRMVSNIEAQFGILEAQQKEINASNNAATQGALFRSGAAQGDAYANLTQNYQVQKGVQALSDLQVKKESAILEAEQAGLNNDFQLQEKMNTLVAGIAQEQAAAGKELQATIQASQKKIQEAKDAMQKESAITELYNKITFNKEKHRHKTCICYCECDMCWTTVCSEAESVRIQED